MSRRRHRRVVAPPTRLGASEEGDLTPPTAPAGRRPQGSSAEQDAAPRPATRPGARPVVPTRAREDTDEAWGELPEKTDDARYLREKPPHWQ